MVNFASAFLFVTAVSAVPSILKRDTAETLTNLRAIDTSTNSLTTTVTNWDGSLLGALGINSAAQSLGTQIDSANAAAQDEATGSSADSQTIIAYITGTLEPDIARSLNALIAKKPQFQSLGLNALVLSNLNSLKGKTTTYSTSLVRIASADQKANAQAAADKITADFNAAIVVFT